MRGLIETIVKPLVDFPDQVSVEEINSNDRIVYKLSVHKEDTGKVIGKHGKTAKAIRTVVYAAAVNEKKHVHIDIV